MEKYLVVVLVKENKGREREGLVDFDFVNILFFFVFLFLVYLCVLCNDNNYININNRL